MPVKVLMERRVHPGRRPEVEELLTTLRSKALLQPGYLQGETLLALEDPLCLVVISRWTDVSRWEAWRSHPARSAILSQIEPLLAEVPKETILVEGISQHKAGP